MADIGGEAGHRGKVIVVGAGIVGTCIAYELAKGGLHVTLLDRDEPGRGCSFGNSGAISPGAVVPLAMPGIVAAASKMMLDPASPLHVPLTYLPRALPWLLRFVASARPERVEAIASALQALHADAVENHLRLALEIGAPELVVRRGHLHLYPDEAALARDAGSWRLRERHGVAFEQLDRAGILALEPGIGPRYNIGIYLVDHATVVNPFRYVREIAKAFVARGGAVTQDSITELHHAADGGWECRGERRSHFGAHVVVAAGVWSGQLLRPLGIRLPLEAQRGYHVTFMGAHAQISRTVVLADRKAFAAPMEDGLRVGGTVEFGGFVRAPNFERSALLARFARETFPDLPAVEESHWMGHRPCMPDSLPCIGPAAGRQGLWLAVGHGHLGLTDSVNTARMLAPQVLANR